MSKNNRVTIDNPCIPVVGNDVPVTNFDYCDFLSKGTETPEACIGSVRIKDMYHSNFSMREYKGHFDRQSLLVNERGVALDHVGICLFIRGEVRSFLNGTQGVHDRSFNNSQNYKYDPGNECVHMIPAHKPFHIAHFSVKTDFFNNLLPHDQSWATVLRTSVEKKQRFIGKKFRPLQKAQLAALQNIYDCPLTGKLGHMMVETSVVQIILLQMHALFDEGRDCNPKMSKRDIDLIYAVKDYITRNFLGDHSLAGLSREFCTNRTKLMNLFRQHFGKSIFEHLSDERMTYAKEMLQQGDKSISEIAYVLGYKNVNHFSTAFKKKFLISPSKVRR